MLPCIIIFWCGGQPKGTSSKEVTICALEGFSFAFYAPSPFHSHIQRFNSCQLLFARLRNMGFPLPVAIVSLSTLIFPRVFALTKWFQHLAYSTLLALDLVILSSQFFCFPQSSHLFCKLPLQFIFKPPGPTIKWGRYLLWYLPLLPYHNLGLQYTSRVGTIQNLNLFLVVYLYYYSVPQRFIVWPFFLWIKGSAN